MLREAQNQIQKTVSSQMEQEKRREQEHLKAVQAENDRLRKEKEELERQAD